MEVWLLLRSLRTLPLRVLQQSKSAAEVVAWLSSGDAPHVIKVGSCRHRTSRQIIANAHVHSLRLCFPSLQ